MGRKRIHADRAAYLREYHKAYKRSYIPASLQGIDPNGRSLIKFAAIRTHEEVGKVMGLSTNKVRLIERKALNRLSMDEELKQYWREIRNG